jgi:hypothetical protein
MGWGGIEIYTPGQPVMRSMDWSGLELYATLFLLVVVGVFPAKRLGLIAGLFVLAGGLFLMSWRIEQVIYFWDQPIWSASLELGVTLLFFIVAPMWVLRSRSVLGRCDPVVCLGVVTRRCACSGSAGAARVTQIP